MMSWQSEREGKESVGTYECIIASQKLNVEIL